MSNHRTYTIVSGIVVILLFLLPQMLPEIYVHLVTEILVYALFAVSFNLLFGYSGLLPFGHAALFGVGAYVAALIFKYYPNVPLLLTFVVATFSGLVPGLVIGFFCVRLKGAYFALITLAFQMFLFAVALRWRSITYGDDGMGVTRPSSVRNCINERYSKCLLLNTHHRGHRNLGLLSLLEDPFGELCGVCA
jgi:branched-chain amino acid transport system permease protein